MPTIAVVAGVRIVIYPGDHNPPHFHGLAGDRAAQIAIADLSVMAGRLPRAKMRAVREWAAENRVLLAREWVRLQE